MKVNLIQMPTVHRCAEALWEERELAPRRANGTFINGPETMDSIARGVILAVLLATLVGLGFWLCWGFSQAERAIVQSISSNGGK